LFSVDCSVWTQTAVSVIRFTVHNVQLSVCTYRCIVWNCNCVPYRADCLILPEVNVYLCPLAPLFGIKLKYIASSKREVLVLVFVVKLYCCGSAAWQNRVHLTSNDIMLTFVLPIVRALEAWNASSCWISKHWHHVFFFTFLCGLNFPCLLFVIIHVKLFLLILIKRQRKLQSVVPRK